MKASSPKKVLVTGASGFIGTQTLQPLIDKGFEVHGVSHQRTSTANVVWHSCDLLDLKAQKKLIQSINPSHLLHMAWYVAPGKYSESPENANWLEISAELFKTFSENGGKRIVAAGSCFEYDWSAAARGPLKCSEKDTPVKPESFYGRCKNELREILSQIPLENSYAWGRIFYLYGVGEAPNRLVPNLIKAMKNETALAVWAPKLIRDYMCVRDVGDAFAAVVNSTHQGAVNVASGKDMRLGDFVTALGPLLHKESKVKAEVTDPPLSPSSPLELTADTQLLNSKIGWHPRYDLATGLREMI